MRFDCQAMKATAENLAQATQLTDFLDQEELDEWLESLEDVVFRHGHETASRLLQALQQQATTLGVSTSDALVTPYLNTIAPEDELPYPGDQALERRIRSLVRWNAMAMVVRANRKHPGLGGHISSYASLATLQEVGFNHFFHAPTADHPGDLVYLHGHSSPGVYARAYLEGRLSDADLERFREEVPRETGLSSYPHPWLMPTFWQFPTVSMGLGPIQAVYQARFLRYLADRQLFDTHKCHVWCFLGDGEMDEPESTAALRLAANSRLDNLTFVINCNLQRLDGPVRGNGKIIQELDGVFRGAGWNVIKVVWGHDWDSLLAADTQGLLRQRMEETVDGEYQKYSVESGEYIRERFFGKWPELRKLVEHLSDDQLRRLNRGGHDPSKVYSAYRAAMEHRGQPSVILAKTIKGYGLGTAGEAQNVTHKATTLNAEELRAFRNRFDIPLKDSGVEDLPFYKPADDSPEIRYLREHREALGGHLPARRTESPRLKIPPLETFEFLLKGSNRQSSTTTSLGSILRTLLKDPHIGERVVPIIPDEARTFGLETLFASYGIYSPAGQKYESVDAHQLIHYKEAVDGQILEEGITEAGAAASFIAAGTSYANLGLPMIPFYLFYSMFGFQRVGDLFWAAGDICAKGFLLGCTAGRTTLAGEGLQHQDGHSLVMASTVPNVQVYDPAYAYEVAVIVHDGLRRMFIDQESIFYYLTLYNEVVDAPPLPDGAAEGILRGMYQLNSLAGDAASSQPSSAPRPQLLGSGTILREVQRAQELLAEKFGIGSDLWSVTSYCQLRRDALAQQRWNRLHPTEQPRRSYLQEVLADRTGPWIAASDFVHLVPDQIRPWVPGRFVTLGTDGFGRSDTRAALRDFFEVSAEHIAFATLSALADEDQFDSAQLDKALATLGIDPEKPNPATT